MNVVCRLFTVFVICHAAYAARCQQMPAEHSVSQPKFMGGITYWGQYRCETVQDIIIAPANGLPVTVNKIMHASEEIKDSMVAANETDSAEGKSSFVITLINQTTMHVSEPVTTPGGP